MNIPQRIFLAFLLFSAAARTVRAQESAVDSLSPGSGLPEVPELDAILGSTEFEQPPHGILDELLRLQEHPVDINTITPGLLRRIPGVSEAEAGALLALRLRLGRLESLDQVVSQIDGGAELVAKLRNYVVCGPAMRGAPGTGPPRVELRSRIQKDLQPRAGFTDGSFGGSRFGVYDRISATVLENLETGVVLEKDAGEAWRHSFRSAFLDLSDLPWGTRLVAGDYTVGAGQGLVIWNSASFERGIGPSALFRGGTRGAEPNRSTDESRYLRGVAVSTMFPGDVAVTGFFSSRNRAASVDDLGRVTSFDESGLFRTAGEIAKRDAVRERSAGGRVALHPPSGWGLGATLCRTDLSREYHPRQSGSFSGRVLSVAGMDGWIRTGDVLWFGEAATVAGGGSAAIGGAVVSIGLNTEAGLSFRSYGRGFATLRGGGFGQGQDTRNEEGVSFAVKTRIQRMTTVNASFDHYRHPWHTPLGIFPSSGSEALLQADIRPRAGFAIATRYTMRRTETGEHAPDSLSGERPVQLSRTQQNLRLTVSLEPVHRLRWRSRVEVVDLAIQGAGVHERGFLLYQDLRYAAASGISVEARLAFFDTESYDTRVYEYENDLRGVFANPALYGRGRRWYILIRSPVVLGVASFACKYAATRKEGVRFISSGDTEIRGDLDDRLGVQLDIRW